MTENRKTQAEALPFDLEAGEDQTEQKFVDDAEAERSAQRLKRFLEKTEERMGILLELMPIGLALHQEQSIIFTNKELCRLLDQEPDDLIGKHCLDFLEVDDNMAFFEKFSAIFKEGTSLNEPDMKLVSANGKTHTVQLIAAPNPWFETPVALVLIQDVSHLKAMERRLHHQSQELASAFIAEQQARKAQKDFISTISHEFRTPLTIIDGSAQMIDRMVEAGRMEKAPEKIGKIRRAVSRMNTLIDDILDASAIDKNSFKLNLQPLDIVGRVQDRCNLMREVSSKHEIILTAENMPDQILCDLKAFTHIVDNLLSNAIKYSPDGNRIEVNISATEKDYSLTVKDYGVGIPASEQKRLFGEYFRASTSQGIPGTGIGLNLVKNLITLLGGTIDVESRVNEWTIFTVQLPIKNSDWNTP